MKISKNSYTIFNFQDTILNLHPLGEAKEENCYTLKRHKLQISKGLSNVHRKTIRIYIHRSISKQKKKAIGCILLHPSMELSEFNNGS